MRWSSRIVVARASSIVRQEARRRREALQRELGDYCSDADRQDLEAILDRYPDGVTAEIREILFRQALRSQTAQRRPYTTPFFSRKHE